MTSRIANWLNLSTLRAFNWHNYCQGFSTKDKMEFMIECDYSLEAGSSAAIWLCHFDCRFFDVFALRPARVNQPLLASTNKERPKEHESALSPPLIPLAASFLPLSAHLSAGWLMKHVTHLSSLMSLSLRPDFNADLVEKTSQWKREKKRWEGEAACSTTLKCLSLSYVNECVCVYACLNGVMLDY